LSITVNDASCEMDYLAMSGEDFQKYPASHPLLTTRPSTSTGISFLYVYVQLKLRNIWLSVIETFPWMNTDFQTSQPPTTEHSQEIYRSSCFPGQQRITPVSKCINSRMFYQNQNNYPIVSDAVCDSEVDRMQ